MPVFMSDCVCAHLCHIKSGCLIVDGYIYVMSLQVCNQTFTASEFGHCCYCPTTPTFGAGLNHGVYPCCNAPAIRFDTSGLHRARGGCCATDHKVDTSARPSSMVGGDGRGNAEILAMMASRMALICTPFKEHKDGAADLQDSEAGSDEDGAENEDEAVSDYSDSEDETGEVPSRRRYQGPRQVRRGPVVTGG